MEAKWLGPAAVMIGALVLVAEVLLLVLAPLGRMMTDSIASGVSGNWQISGDLAVPLLLKSLIHASGASALSLVVGILVCAASRLASMLGRAVLVVSATLLIVNPLYYVFGFSVLLVDCDPNLAVWMASAFVALPLTILLSAMTIFSVPRSEVLAAFSLGASSAYVLFGHFVKANYRALSFTWALSAIYVLGFYLVPAYVGFGRIGTLATAIDRAINRTGDWTAGGQLALLMFGVVVVIFATAALATIAGSSSVVQDRGRRQ